MEYGCIGEKLKHSFSKEIHNKLFSYNYELKEIQKSELDFFMRQKDFKAINVTIPYKRDVIEYLDVVSETAGKIGAVNTVVNENGKLYGYNTDFSGMRALILKNGLDLSDKKVLILGSGGTSATAVAVAESLSAGKILRVSRKSREGFITYEEAVKNHGDAEIIINTTPVGMFPNIGESPVNVADFKNLSGVVDAVYNPLSSKLVCDAKSLGITAAGGLYMLVAQAVFAAEKFVGLKIPNEKIDSIYKEILLSKKNIVLIGMPSSGKSTIGKALAECLGRKFTDIDALIEMTEGRPVSRIIESEGEPYFRRVEAEAAASVSASTGVVIATGGGTVLFKKNVELLRENGRIYFLDRPLSKLIITDDRPLSNDRQKLKQLYDERYDIYCESADVIIKCVDDIEKNIQTVKEDFLNAAFNT